MTYRQRSCDLQWSHDLQKIQEI